MVRVLLHWGLPMRALRTSISILALAIAGPALAADLPSRHVAPAAPAVAPIFTWTGFYAGVNIGGAWEHGSLHVRDEDTLQSINLGAALGLRESDSGGFTGGAQIGYNYQIGQFVLGAEADFNYINVNRRIAGTVVDHEGDGGSVFAKATVNWYGTVRARLGFTPTERLLVYATGGLAYGQVKHRMSVADDIGEDSWAGRGNHTQWGWTLGAGLEYAITNNLTLRGEYLYVDLGDKNTRLGYTGTDAALAGDTLTLKSDTQFSVVRAGLNYKF
jgi:outer membrane immunogenic protein